jgi:hypothetical protein
VSGENNRLGHDIDIKVLSVRKYLPEHTARHSFFRRFFRKCRLLLNLVISPASAL